jgi:vacuolar fusion protein MON1
VSSTGEPEAVLVKQLQFMYTQILLVLTAKVHEVLRNNFSKDIRDLLGSETTRLMQASCRHDITSPCIAYSAVRGMVMDRELRAEVMRYVQHCVVTSGAASGLLLHEESLVAYCINEESGLVLNVSDLLLLTHFVGNSSSLRTNEHNWVPICLPTFNSKAYLQAYVANFKSDGGGIVQRPVELSLVLIATSTDPELFKELHHNSTRFQRYVSQKEVVQKMAFSIEDKQKYRESGYIGTV